MNQYYSKLKHLFYQLILFLNSVFHRFYSTQIQHTQMLIICILVVLLPLILSQPITMKCGKCFLSPQCKSGICRKYNGAAFQNIEQCVAQSTSCPQGQQTAYYPTYCSVSTNNTQCSSGCCLRYLPISSAKTFCADNYFRSELYCQKVIRNQVTALIIVITLTALCFGSLVIGFFASKCCKNRQDIEREEQLQQAKRVEEQKKQKRDQRRQNKILAVPNESTLKSGNVSNNNSIGVISKNSISIADQLGRQIALESNQALQKADI